MLQPDLRGDEGRTPQQGEAERRHAVEHGAAAAGRRRRTQTATLIAPSTDSTWPLTKPAAGLIRNTAAPPRSSRLAQLRIGVRHTTQALNGPFSTRASFRPGGTQVGNGWCSATNPRWQTYNVKKK